MMASPGKLLPLVLFIGAGLLSAVVSALGTGIFLWGSSLGHPNPQGVLLCVGPILSLPFFVVAFLSRDWQRWLMWLSACASFIGAFIATVGMSPLRMPLVILSIVIAVLVECSYRLKRRGVGVRS